MLLECEVSIYSNSENAIAAEGMQIVAINLPQGLKPSSIFAFDNVRAKARTLHLKSSF
jgi:hypothetical protein